MTGIDYFERMYAESPDPWSLSERPYERRKYELTIASLPDVPYRRAYEPGCSIGVLTQMLVERCDTVIASDPVPQALAATRERAPSAELIDGALPGTWPEGNLDLVVFSEVLYFLSSADRAASIEGAQRALEPGGMLVSVNWRHAFDEAECDGDQVQREIRGAAGFAELVWHEERDFTLVVMVRA